MLGKRAKITKLRRFFVILAQTSNVQPDKQSATR